MAGGKGVLKRTMSTRYEKNRRKGGPYHSGLGKGERRGGKKRPSLLRASTSTTTEGGERRKGCSLARAEKRGKKKNSSFWGRNAYSTRNIERRAESPFLGKRGEKPLFRKRRPANVGGRPKSQREISAIHTEGGKVLSA